MADSVGNKLIYWDGMKSFDLEEYPPEAWTFYSNRPDEASDVYRQAVPWVYRSEQIRSFSVMNMPFSIYKGNEEVTSSADYDNVTGIIPNPKQLLNQIEM